MRLFNAPISADTKFAQLERQVNSGKINYHQSLPANSIREEITTNQIKLSTINVEREPAQDKKLWWLYFPRSLTDAIWIDDWHWLPTFSERYHTQIMTSMRKLFRNYKFQPFQLFVSLLNWAILNHSQNLGKIHVSCQVLEILGQNYKIYTSTGVLIQFLSESGYAQISQIGKTCKF